MPNKDSESRATIVLRPGDVDFDARKLRDLEVADALGVGVKGGWYDQSSVRKGYYGCDGCDGLEIQR